MSQKRAMTYLTQQAIGWHWERQPSNLGPEWQQCPQVASYRLSGCVLCRSELSVPGLVRPLPRHLETALYRLPRVYGFVVEMHSFVHRMASRYRRHFGVYSVLMPPLSIPIEGGVRKPNTRTRSCIDDMRSFAVNHPWATILDLETYRDAWLAGAAWNANNSCKTETVIVPEHS